MANTLRPQTRWIIIGGCGLAFLGAATNAFYLIKLGTSVSHLTGDLAKVAMNAAEGQHHGSKQVLNLIFAAASFVLGAAVAGFFIHHPNIEFSRPYGRAITAIGVCLTGAHFSFEAMPGLSISFAGFACGLQNALATHYRGMVLRTTHITGLLTDLGTNLGMRFKGYDIARWKLLVPACLVTSFFAGAVFGSTLTIVSNRPTLLILAMIYIVGGIGWSIYKHLVLTKPARSLSNLESDLPE